MVTCRAQLGTVMEELERMKNIDSRLEVLEQGRPDLAQQGDQEHGEGGGIEGRRGRHTGCGMGGNEGRKGWHTGCGNKRERERWR